MCVSPLWNLFFSIHSCWNLFFPGKSLKSKLARPEPKRTGPRRVKVLSLAVCGRMLIPKKRHRKL